MTGKVEGYPSLSNQGSAKVLEGRIYVLSIFVTESDWALDTKLDIFKSIRDGQKWLEQQASSYQKNVEFVNGEVGVFEPFVAPMVPDYDSGKPSITFVREYLEKAGYPSGRAFMEWVRKRTGCGQAFVFVVANRFGRGYALPFVTGAEDYFLEGCILYCGPSETLSPCSVAHEFLHLFGAWDLYPTDVQSVENSNRMDRMYPYEVMHKGSSLEQMQMSPLTAWLVGLTDKTETWFESFRPKM